MTSTTIVALSSPAFMEEFGRIVTLVTVIAFALFCAAHEIVSPQTHLLLRRLLRGLDISTMPLLVVVAMMLFMNLTIPGWPQ